MHVAYALRPEDPLDVPGRRLVAPVKGPDQHREYFAVANRVEDALVWSWPQRLWRVGELADLFQYTSDRRAARTTRSLFAGQMTLIAEEPIAPVFGPRGSQVVVLLERIGRLTIDEVARAGAASSSPLSDVPRDHPRARAGTSAFLAVSSAIEARAAQVEPAALGEVYFDVAFPPTTGLVSPAWQAAADVAQLAARAIVLAGEPGSPTAIADVAAWVDIVGG